MVGKKLSAQFITVVRFACATLAHCAAADRCKNVDTLNLQHENAELFYY